MILNLSNFFQGNPAANLYRYKTSLCFAARGANFTNAQMFPRNDLWWYLIALSLKFSSIKNTSSIQHLLTLHALFFAPHLGCIKSAEGSIFINLLEEGVDRIIGCTLDVRFFLFFLKKISNFWLLYCKMHNIVLVFFLCI